MEEYADIRDAAIQQGETACSAWLRLPYSRQEEIVEAFADGEEAYVHEVKEGCLGEEYSNAKYIYCKADKFRTIPDHVACSVASSAYDPHEESRREQERKEREEIDSRIEEGD